MKGVSGREWYLLSDQIKPEEDLVRRFGYFLAQLLVNRGFEDPRSAFDLKLKYLIPYTFLPNLGEGAQRIVEAVKKRKRILIFGDYDVDGITGSAILYEVLRRAGARVVSVLPNRGTGYGLNDYLISLFSRYADLLITVDNGTSAVREIDGSGIEVVVIDHHNVPERTPERAVLVNPKLKESVPKDLQEISSSAMCFYMALVVSRQLGLDIDVRNFLDLVALGTVGDVMPMNRTNRILVSKGIAVLEGVLRGTLSKPGVRALLKISGIRNGVSSRDIAYSIAPRLNAPGRVGNPKISLHLLLEDRAERAELLARKVEILNSRRRAITDLVYREARERAREQKNRSFVSLWNPGWHVGVLGIVAGRLSAQLGKPVAVFAEGKEQSVGSVRSVEGIDVYEGLRQLSHLFLKWGGHSQAAGVTLSSGLLEEFSRRAEDIFEHVPRKPPPLYVDMEFPPTALSPQILSQIDRLEPYGEGNPPPTFLSPEENLQLTELRFGRGRVRVGNVEMVCWERDVIERLKSGLRARVVYTVSGGRLSLIDVEDRDGAR